MKKANAKDRTQTSITMRFPVDMVETLKEIAPQRGFSGYQPLIKFYVSEGLRRDQELLQARRTHRFVEALRDRGIPETLLQEAARDAGL